MCYAYSGHTKEVYKREDGRNFVCAPPMKGADSKEALWDAIMRGDIDTVASDHCPFQWKVMLKTCRLALKPLMRSAVI